jgi:16S rRNA (cytosine967-C5)-methyltransferase
MTPSARLQSAIEILDLVIDAAKDNGPAADTILAGWFKTRRFVGSKDRRAIREYVYAAVRAFGTRPHSGRAAFLGLDKALRPLFDGSQYGPAEFKRSEAVAGPSPLSAWLAGLIDPAEHAALLNRAPLDLRVNRLKAQRDAVMAELPGSLAVGRDCVRLVDNLIVEGLPMWHEGFIDIQDAGSQVIAQACRAEAAMTVVDLCAGAGGKTLALAADMGRIDGEGAGRLIATDTNRDRLQRIQQRGWRLGAGEVETRLLDPGKEIEALGDLIDAADVVLVDAPCSGSGTWRRNPEARWRLTPTRLEQLIATQRHVLALGASLVKPGGTLVYAVCSLIDGEGCNQVDAFLTANKGWRRDDIDVDIGRSHGAGLILTPAHDEVDGFFIARLIRS